MQDAKINPVPNIITTLNLISGCISISMAIQGNYEIAAYLILLSAVFDFLDGMSAKLLNAVSSFGKVYDSIVDIVSFGVAPSILMYQIMVMSLTYSDSTFNLESANFKENIIILSSFLLTVFAGIRLARFTADTKERDYFRGMPTPASAIIISSLSIVLFTSEISTLQEFILDSNRLLILNICISILMVLNVPMLKMKFSNFRIKENLIKYIIIISSIVLLIVFQFAGIPLIILLYIILSIFNTLIKSPVD